MSKKYRDDIEPPPYKIAALPVERGYPVPWFVPWINGKPEFRMADHKKLVQAVREKRCWICGQSLGKLKAFVLGPLSCINRCSAEPPSHQECATYAAKNCPFLSKPQMVRRDHDEIEKLGGSAGIMITRNPGVCVVWSTQSFAVFQDNARGVLFEVGEPTKIEWYASGRAAQRSEVEQSINEGLPTLRDLCDMDGPSAHQDLDRRLEQIQSWLPTI